MNDYSAWLIERRDMGMPHWLKFDLHGFPEWTPDANQACHFSRRRDAESMAVAESFEMFVCDHGWPGLTLKNFGCLKCNYPLDSFSVNAKCPGCGRFVEPAEAE